MPYQGIEHNILEFREYLTGAGLLFGGLIFVSSTKPGFFDWLMVIALVFVNLWFFVLWLHLFLKSMPFKSVE